jgi:pSer/pThr/pTyr-binding forkhead associated (FHA) protein
MHRGLKRILLMSGIGAAAGAVAALIGYSFREPDLPSVLSLDSTVKVDELTLSNEMWAIVGLSLLGALVCGGIATVYVARKGPARMMLALFVAAPLGGFLCWGARWVMDQMIYSSLGGPGTRIDMLDASNSTLVPWAVWQLGCGFALAMPIAIGIGLNKFTFLRGLIGSALVMVIGFVLGIVLTPLIIALLLFTFLAGGNAVDTARAGDVIYLFSLGAAAGIAFGIAENVYKPVWLKSVRGPSEGRQWSLAGQLTRIGSMEGVEVYLPPDGTVAPVHAQVQSEDDAHFIVDLGGGLTVNGAPAQSAWLKDGDQLGVGSALILYRTRLDGRGKEQPRVPELHVKQPCLVDSLGNRHLLHIGINVVGRELGCDVAFTWEPSVSRRHAELTVGPGYLTVRDLGSTNGTFVQGQPVTGETSLQSGSEVVFGRCRTTVEL